MPTESLSFASSHHKFLSLDGLGFNIRGGYDMPHMPNDDGVFVTKIRENGAAALDGRLHEGDKILTVHFIPSSTILAFKNCRISMFDVADK